MCVRLIGESKLAIRVNVTWNDCLSHLSLCGTVMDYLMVSWIGFTPLRLSIGLSGYRKWMDDNNNNDCTYLHSFSIIFQILKKVRLAQVKNRLMHC